MPVEVTDPPRKMTLGAAIEAGSFALLAALLVVCVLLVQQTYRNDSTNRAFGHLTAIRAGLERVFSLLQDAETGQRGYLLTGQDRFLAPYTTAEHHLYPELTKLAAQMSGGSYQHARILDLDAVAHRKMEELSATIRLYRQGRHDAALAIVRTGDGLALMEKARRITNEVQAIQTRERADRMAYRDAQFNRTVFMIGALIAALCLAIVFIAAMAVFHLRARDRIIADVRFLTDQLGAEKVTLEKTVRELDAAKTAADKANRTKSEFLANISHELRTPLNAILGFSEIIKDELFGAVGARQYADYAGDVHRSGQHLLALINDILDLSKIDAGKVDMREENVDLEHLLSESLSLVRERALSGGVKLVQETSANEAIALADRRLLKQILLNLLSNAIKFTPKGGCVTTRVFRDNAGIGFSVQDSGIGMSLAEIEKALSPYGQIDSKISRKHQGTGLGLPISHSLAKLHGGDLRIESNPGSGTTITLVLPAARAVALTLHDIAQYS